MISGLVAAGQLGGDDRKKSVREWFPDRFSAARQPAEWVRYTLFPLSVINIPNPATLRLRRLRRSDVDSESMIDTPLSGSGHLNIFARV